MLANREMYHSGQYTVAAIATTLGVSRASIYRHLTGADSKEDRRTVDVAGPGV